MTAQRCESAPRREGAAAEHITQLTGTMGSAAAAESTSATQGLTSVTSPIAYGRELAQDQRRRWPLIVVEDCPFNCGGAHGHRGVGIKESGCGRRYLVVVAP